MLHRYRFQARAQPLSQLQLLLLPLSILLAVLRT
jgi:hypothetical protein